MLYNELQKGSEDSTGKLYRLCDFHREMTDRKK